MYNLYVRGVVLVARCLLNQCVCVCVCVCVELPEDGTVVSKHVGAV
jgi:hypothetical protein